LTVKQLQALEVLSATADQVQDRAAAGAFCFMAYSRARFSDLQCISDLSFELNSSGIGFVEASAIGTKTATTLAKKTRFLPITAVVEPLTRFNWALEWEKARQDAGLEGHRFLLPAPLVSGGWSERPLTSDEACRWLRDLLVRANCLSQHQALGTHSLKVTMLSWMAKYGASPTVRRLLGYHVEPGDQSLLTYSRDAAAGPLRELASVLRMVRAGSFSPDASRSGRFLTEDPLAENLPAVNEDDCTSVLSDKSSAGSSSVESIQQALEVDALVEKESNRRSEDDKFDTLDGKLLYRCGSFGMLHFKEHRNSLNLMCGRKFHRAYVLFSQRPGGVLLCDQCYGKALNLPQAFSLITQAP
jgi:hypothetical protein